MLIVQGGGNNLEKIGSEETVKAVEEKNMCGSGWSAETTKRRTAV